MELATARYLRWSGYHVLAGPFRGLRYLRRAHCSALLPKIAGTYELELRPWLDQLFHPRPEVFVDIGAAEGYYAVGAAVAGWCDRIIAYEADPDARASLAELAALNPHPRAKLEQRGLCTTDDLESLLSHYPHAAILIDVEGGEDALLDPEQVPHLRGCRILVEYHDFIRPGLSDQIRMRFTPTHQITRILPRNRRPSELPGPTFWRYLLPSAVRWRMLRELRPMTEHGWLYLEPRP